MLELSRVVPLHLHEDIPLASLICESIEDVADVEDCAGVWSVSAQSNEGAQVQAVFRGLIQFIDT